MKDLSDNPTFQRLIEVIDSLPQERVVKLLDELEATIEKESGTTDDDS